MLDVLIRWGELPSGSFGFPVTLLVGDRLIEGHIAPPEEWAELSDDVLDAALEKAKDDGQWGWTPEQWDQVKQDLESVTFKRLLARRRERDERDLQEMEEMGNPELEELISRGGELSRELAQKLAQRAGPRPAFTLSDAVIETSSGATTKIGTIRVVTTHVSAWWIGRSST
jgi:hypothetical protein